MTHQEFTDAIYTALAKHAHRYNIKVFSPIIAQACLESGWGTSELAVKANNFFGLKYREGRCPTAIDKYVKVGSEQNPDGSYASSVMLWCKFNNLEDCVIGYLDFINNSRYNNLKDVTDPYTYLINIKADGYATSLSYVDNLMKVIQQNNLTSYDRKEINEMSTYTNSPLVCYTKISPNRTVCNNRTIDTITIHCMAGNMKIESCGELFAKASRAASSNYGIGSDGRIGLYVEEKDRSWCTSNRDNDMRAITIEVANTAGAPDWPISDEAYEALVTLCTDICKRNGIKKLVWSTDKNTRMNHLNGCNMTVHRDYAAKACPGDYIYNRLGQIADEVNSRLGNVKEPAKVEKPVETVKPVEETGYSLKQFIRDIQECTGSKVDGIAGPETIGNTITLCEHRNKRHKAVKFVQKRLYALGFTEVGEADGVAGPKFTAAVTRYQKEIVKLTHPDGIISAKHNTWKKLLGMI